MPVHEDKGADDPGEVTCFTSSNKGSNSEVQSLSSFQSDSGDDNGKRIPCPAPGSAEEARGATLLLFLNLCVDFLPFLPIVENP